MPEPSTAILLTGAGFTHNFGSYLARDMWAQIFNHEAVQKHSSVQRAMRNSDSFNFEAAYDDILYGDFREEEKTAIVEGLSAAFANLDEIVTEFNDTPSSIPLNSLARFIERFAGTPGNPGYIFTLNQDLFMERQVPFDGVLTTLPGLKQGDRFNRNTFRHRPLDSIRLQLPSEDEVKGCEDAYPKGAQHLVYVKLHGSTEWRGHDGSVRPVIGRQKTKIIDQEPLLRWYARLFQQAITTPPNRKLLVIGYGFEDPHINDTIRLACADHGLRLYVVDPAEPGDLLWKKLRDWSDQSWRGWAGYFRCTLHDLFARSNPTAQGKIFLRNILHALFELP